MPAKILPEDDEILQKALKLLKVDEWTKGTELGRKLGIFGASLYQRLSDPRIATKLTSGNGPPYRVYRLRSE